MARRVDYTDPTVAGWRDDGPPALSCCRATSRQPATGPDSCCLSPHGGLPHGAERAPSRERSLERSLERSGRHVQRKVARGLARVRDAQASCPLAPLL